MRRFSILSWLMLVPVSLAISGCLAGPEEPKEPSTRKRAVVTGGGSAAGGGGALAELAAPTDGVIKGRVELDPSVGVPKIEEVAAMALHADKGTCMSPTAKGFEKTTQQWILSDDKKSVANVVIKLLPPAGKKFKSMEPAKREVEIDQPHCAFVPHVVAVAPGQVLKVLNSSPIAHNTKTQVDSSVNDGASVTISPNGGSKEFSFKPQRAPIQLSCDFHNWMTAQVHVVDTPYIAVTDRDGNFEIRNVPTGTELVVVGLHEAGDVDGGKTGQKMTFKAGENRLDLKVKPR